MASKTKIILGIDPGTTVLGYGLVGVAGNKVSLIAMGVIHLSKYKDIHERLLIILQKVQEICANYHPTDFAIEAPFFGKNVQSMLKLGRAQGVAMAGAMTAGLKVYEYMPKTVKQSVTGNGNATKEQVWLCLQQILKFKETPEYLDATDAVAVALCHHYQGSGLKLNTKNKKSGWEDFIKQNPDKIKLK